MLNQPDPRLLARAAAGDDRAFEALVRAYWKPLYHYVHRMVGDPGDAEDICQDVCINLHHGLRTFQDRARFTTWLFQVAKHRVIDHLRSKERPLPTIVDDTVWPVVGGAMTEPHVERREDQRVLWEAIDSLNPDLKAALLCRDLIGLSYQEIAEVLDATLTTVKWRIFKAREEVQRRLGGAVAARPVQAKVVERTAEPPAGRPPAASPPQSPAAS